MVDRRSIWGWCLQSEEPTVAQRDARAKELSALFGVGLSAAPPPDLAKAELRAPRLQPPASLADCLTTEVYERAYHAYGAHFTDYTRAFQLDFPEPPDVVAHPRSEAELVAVMDWAGSQGAKIVPYGGGSSVVWGVSPPPGADKVVTIALDCLDQVLEVDHTSRAARIQAGVLGPHLEAQLKPHGYTLRHFPQSFRFSSLGGWIATRSGGHYATNHTHIDDFVESVRMVTPQGPWESRRLPGSGAGPSPDRLVIGSEGILGIITEAWMRVQQRPTYRATAGITFPTWQAGTDAVRQIVQAKLWPANLRILDPVEAKRAAGLDGNSALVIVSFESAELTQAWNIAQAIAIARAAGGHIPEEEVHISEGTGEATGRGGAVGAWRDAFIGVNIGLDICLGLVSDTFETSITWDHWPEFDALVRERMTKVLGSVLGKAQLSCRFTHVYPDGPAPYYTWSGMGRQGSEISMWQDVKDAANEVVIDAGGTITHHHAVGRMHRPGYDRQRPDLFASALGAAKRVVDPAGLLNPGVLIDP